MSFADKYAPSEQPDDFIYSLTAKDKTGKDAYYFFLVDPEKHEEFKASIREGKCNLESYGRVLASGYGHEPSDRVKKFMKEVYDFDCDNQ